MKAKIDVDKLLPGEEVYVVGMMNGGNKPVKVEHYLCSEHGPYIASFGAIAMTIDSARQLAVDLIDLIGEEAEIF